MWLKDGMPTAVRCARMRMNIGAFFQANTNLWTKYCLKLDISQMRFITKFSFRLCEIKQ